MRAAAIGRTRTDAGDVLAQIVHGLAAVHRSQGVR
jgi:hypothetical protein